MPLPKIVVNAKNSGSSDRPTAAAPGAIPAFRNRVKTEATIKVRIPQSIRLGHILLRIARLFRRQRELFDGEVKPDGKGQCLGNTAPAEGQKAGIAGARRNVQSHVPVEMWDSAIQNTSRMAKAMMVMKTENLNGASTPTMLRPTNRA